MSISFGSGLVIVSSFWTELENFVLSKSLLLQYSESADIYEIFAIDDSVVYFCTIYRQSVPDGILPVYSQAQNDADELDFETNFKPTANSRIAREDQFGAPLVSPLSLSVAAGKIPGAVSGTINGYTATAAVTAKAIRATAYVAGTANAQRSISSANAADTAAGTGARTVKITYYNNAMAGPFTETITLNGVAAVNTVSTTIRYIEKIEVMTVGSGGANAGTITLFLGLAGGGGAMAAIAASDNSTFYCHHYVPAGKTCYVIGLRTGATVTNGSAILTSTGDPGSTILATRNVTGNLRHGAANQLMAFLSWDPPLPVTGPNLIIVTTRPDAGTASTAYGSFDYIEF